MQLTPDSIPNAGNDASSPCRAERFSIGSEGSPFTNPSYAKKADSTEGSLEAKLTVIISQASDSHLKFYHVNGRILSFRKLCL